MRSERAPLQDEASAEPDPGPESRACSAPRRRGGHCISISRWKDESAVARAGGTIPRWCHSESACPDGWEQDDRDRRHMALSW